MGVLGKILKKKKLGQNLILSLDIGTEFVKALIFKIDPEQEKGIILGVGRQKQRPEDIQSGSIADIAGLVNTCQRAVSQAEKMAEGRPEQVVLGIAGGLVKGATTTIYYQRQKPESKIDLPELKNIIQKVQWKAFDKIRPELAWETGHSEIEIKLVNAAIVDFRIDGYQVTNPLGFKGREISIRIFNAYAPLVHLGALQSIASDLNLDCLSIAAEPTAIAHCLGTADSVDFDAIFIDLGGGTTDLAVVKNGAVEGTKMLALGGRTFTKRLAQELSVGFDEAEEIKLKYSTSSLSPGVTKKIGEILKKDLSIWLSGVELALGEFSNLELLPSKIFLCGGGSLLPGVKTALSRADWIKNLPLAKKPVISFVQPGDVVNVIDRTKKLNSPIDIPSMALANLALGLVSEEGVLAGILRRTLRMMQR